MIHLDHEIGGFFFPYTIFYIKYLFKRSGDWLGQFKTLHFSLLSWINTIGLPNESLGIGGIMPLVVSPKANWPKKETTSSSWPFVMNENIEYLFR